LSWCGIICETILCETKDYMKLTVYIILSLIRSIDSVHAVTVVIHCEGNCYIL